MSSDLPKLIEQLYKVNRAYGCKLGLTNAHALNQSLRFPDHAFASVHVAGSNGKGSVTTKIAKALELAGYKVGCYTSPHLSSYRERIKINGREIPEATIEERLPFIMNLAQQLNINATFFEITTALAFDYFAREKVDIAVIETGLGGRLDATNIITPILSVITTISLEHTQILGKTLDEIAFEKGGIIKPGVPVVVGWKADLQKMRDIAQERNSPYHVAPLVEGDFDNQNNQTATLALQLLAKTYALTPSIISQAMLTRPPCRIECVAPDQLRKKNIAVPHALYLDVAHNPEAISSLLDAIDIRHPGSPASVVCGFSKDKDVLSCLKILQPRIQHFYLVAGNHERALSVEELREVCIQAGLSPASLTCCPVVDKAIAQACQASGPSGVVLVCGTFFIMGEARQAVGFQEATDPINLNESRHYS